MAERKTGTAETETETVLSVPERAAAFHLELAMLALRVGGRLST